MKLNLLFLFYPCFERRMLMFDYVFDCQIATNAHTRCTENERFNDAKCDRKGRLFVGTMLEDPTNNTVIPLSGDLYRLDGEQLTAVAHQFTVSNGMAWSSDDSTFYFNDSDDQKIWRFDYDITSGQVSNQRLLIDVKQNRLGIRSNEYPDGMCIDANDNLWIALWGGARVVKIDVQKGTRFEFVKLHTLNINHNYNRIYDRK